MNSPKTDRLANIVTIALFVLSIVVGAPLVYKRLSGGGLKTLSDLSGIHLDSLVTRVEADSERTLRLVDRRTILYQFATDCPYCISQKRHVGQILATLSADPTIRVITASDEAPALIQKYWASEGFQLEPPVSLAASSLQRIKGYTVPRIYFIDKQATITTALQGTIEGWTVEDMKRRLR